MKKLKQSYNNDEIHNELSLQLREYILNMPEFEVTPMIICNSDNEKGFGVISDNGHGDLMKRFTIIIKDHKQVKSKGINGSVCPDCGSNQLYYSTTGRLCCTDCVLG